MNRSLNTIPITTLKGVGDTLADKLARIGIRNIQDLLFHLPLRYQDRTRITLIASLQPRCDVVIQGKILASDIVMGKRRSLLCRISDGSGSISLRFFHFTTAQKNNLRQGTEIRCFGEPRRGAAGLEMYHPEYRIINSDNLAEIEETLTPVYPVTEGLTQQRIRNLCEQALKLIADERSLQELLPVDIRKKYLTDTI